MPEKLLITSALPYANGPLHFGHIAGAYLPGDCFARFKRLRGCDVLYLCGSDEYGVAISLSAETAHRTPQEQVDLFHGINREFFSRLHISFDHYSRTTWKRHKEAVQEFFLDLLANGHIEEKMSFQLFSEKDNRFLADRYVQGVCPKCGFDGARGDECQSCGASYEATDLLKPVSKISGSPLVLKETKHWFLRFDHFKERLEKWIGEKRWKQNVTNFALSYVKDLKPRAITRDSDWGVPIPLKGTEGKVFYVWFDAPIGYISSAKEWAELKGEPDLWKQYWMDEKTRLVHFIGKDNIPFHSVFFPAMIMGQNAPYKLVDDLPANEFYNLEGKQFSKSEGRTIDLDSFFAQFSADQIRYVIASNAPETQDSEFHWKDFQSRCNADLLGKYGNFVNRVLTFVRKNCEGKIPPLDETRESHVLFLEKIKAIAGEAAEAYDAFHLRKACQHVMELAQAGNVFFDAGKPWQLAKDPSDAVQMRSVLRCCMECIKLLALVSAPVIPVTAEKVWALLGFSGSFNSWDDVVARPLETGRSIPEPEILFSRVEDEVIERERKLLQERMDELSKKNSQQVPTPVKEGISFEDVKKMDLRVAEILSVERVAKSKKLLKLRVSLGTEERTVVAGIGENLPDPQVLIGRKIIVVANLKPATLMGIESQGMVLAAKGSEGFELPLFLLSRPGDVVA